MLETLWESQLPAPASGERKASKPAKVAKSIRPTRLQLEQLERREVPSASVAAGDVDADLEVMQASQISAFFQQSALVTAGRPTTDPTVGWARRSNKTYKPRRSSPRPKSIG